MAQASLLKFFGRSGGTTGKKRHPESSAPTSQEKRIKVAGPKPSFLKLKRYARQKEASSSTSTMDTASQNESSSSVHQWSPGQSEPPDVIVVADDEDSSGQSTQGHLHTVGSSAHQRVKDGSTQPSSRSSVQTGLPLSLSKQYTPLEQQFRAIKAQHPDAVLFVECGYKYKFFGEDAEIASKVLNIGCFPDHNFMSASIPTHRLHVHLRRLVAAGHKVGVVKQMETAALKAASDRKSGPFSRELTSLYTRTTLLGPDVEGGRHLPGSLQEEEEGLYLMCLCEGSKKKKETVIGFLALQPSAGNMVYDEFTESTSTFTQLETRLSHLQPAEILYPQEASRELENALLEWKRFSGTVGLRLEKLPEEWFDYNKAFPTVSDFYGGKEDSGVSKMAEGLQIAVNLPSSAISCLGAVIRHLQGFKLERVLMMTSNLQPFSTGTYCMRLTSNTLNNLEIFRNNTDRTEKGSLFWVLNHTHTTFGKRLLKKWVSYPLRNIQKIQQRQAAVTELCATESPCLSFLKETLCKLPDLEKMLCAAYHKKCSPSSFCFMVRALVGAVSRLQSITEMVLSDLQAELLQVAVKEVPSLLGDVHEFLEALNESAAREGEFEELFAKPEQFPAMMKEKKAISELQQMLMEYRRQIRRTLGSPSLDYITVSGTQYLVEVSNKNINRVPSDWTTISRTKQVTRFHPPYVLEAVKLLAQHREQLKINAIAAWDEFLNDFGDSYGVYKKAVDLLATLDCLLSLARVAKMPGYACPTVVEEAVVHIEEGRHPIIDQLLGEGEQYVPNDTELSTSGLYTMIITGPNMGGKSCYIKQVALLCIMAQIGSYVPATAATLGVLDAVYTRMGARDSIFTGKSTFMLELMEASEIMKLATPSSLVIMDELGRGTSTHDGTAVAYATLSYFIQEVKCMVLFVTHYPVLAKLEEAYPSSVGNFHMAYFEAEESSEYYEKIVFLYQLERGQARGSYGLHVAALAGLDHGILRVAGEKSTELQVAGVNSQSKESSAVETFRRILSLLYSRQHGSESQIITDFLTAVLSP